MKRETVSDPSVLDSPPESCRTLDPSACPPILHASARLAGGLAGGLHKHQGEKHLTLNGPRQDKQGPAPPERAMQSSLLLCAVWVKLEHETLVRSANVFAAGVFIDAQHRIIVGDLPVTTAMSLIVGVHTPEHDISADQRSYANRGTGVQPGVHQRVELAAPQPKGVAQG